MTKQGEKEELLALLGKVKHMPVIVEGKRDQNVLRLFGFTKITQIRKGIYETAEEAVKKHKRIMILTDFDREGSKIAAQLTLFLQKLGCKVESNMRRKIKFAFVKNKITAIEELKSLLKKR
ncbi:MAG: toprim domain-containing protein [Candidatus Aenigmatarchaeota archaeon]